jgi:hypothetical protein
VRHLLAATSQLLAHAPDHARYAFGKVHYGVFLMVTRVSFDSLPAGPRQSTNEIAAKIRVLLERAEKLDKQR